MLSGRGREVVRLSSAIPSIFLARQPSEVAKIWGNCSTDSLVTSSLTVCPLWAKTQGLLSTWRAFIWLCESMCGCWVTGKGVSCPVSHVIPESSRLVVLGLPQLKACPRRLCLMQMFSLWYVFRSLAGVTFGSCLSFDHQQNRKRGLAFFFIIFFCFPSFSSYWILWHDSVNYQSILQHVADGGLMM